MPDLFPPTVGVFTRNHKLYIEEAVAKKDIVLRSNKRWTSVEEHLQKGEICIVYLAVVDDGPIVQYKACLEEVLLNPIRGQRATDDLLKLTHSGIDEDVLLKMDGKPVLTLYRLTDCEKITPFPMTELIKIKGGEPISAEYGYGYTLVKPRSEDTPG